MSLDYFIFKSIVVNKRRFSFYLTKAITLTLTYSYLNREMLKKCFAVLQLGIRKTKIPLRCAAPHPKFPPEKTFFRNLVKHKLDGQTFEKRG